MSRELGVQFARERIRVNALCPGPVNTPLLQELFAKDPERAARRLVHIPIGRFAEPEEIAAAVAFLASDDASFITAVFVPRRRWHQRRLRDAAIEASAPPSDWHRDAAGAGPRRCRRASGTTQCQRCPGAQDPPPAAPSARLRHDQAKCLLARLRHDAPQGRR